MEVYNIVDTDQMPKIDIDALTDVFGERNPPQASDSIGARSECMKEM